MLLIATRAIKLVIKPKNNKLMMHKIVLLGNKIKVMMCKMYKIV